MTFWEYEPGDQAGERRKSAFEELANSVPNPIEAAGQQARELQEFLQSAEGSNPFANFNTGDGTSGAAPPLPAPVSPPVPPELPGDPYKVQAPAGNRVAALPTPPDPPAPAAPVDDARQATPGEAYTLPDYTPGFLAEARRQHEAAQASMDAPDADRPGLTVGEVAAEAQEAKDRKRDIDTGFQVGSTATTRALGGDATYVPPSEERTPPPALLTSGALDQAVDAQGGRIDFRPDTNEAYSRGAQDLGSYVQQASGRATNHPEAQGVQVDQAIQDAGGTAGYMAAEGAVSQLIGAPAQAINALFKALVGEDVYGRPQDALDRLMAVPDGISAIMSIIAPAKSPVMALRFYGPGAVTNYLVGQGVKPEYANLAGVLVDLADPGEAMDVARLGGKVEHASDAAKAAEAFGGVALGGAAGIRAAQQGKNPVDVASAALDAFDSGRMVGGAVDNPNIRAAGRAVQAAPGAVSDFYRGGAQVNERGDTGRPTPAGIKPGGTAVDQHLPLIQEKAAKYGIDPSLLAAVVDFESTGNPAAVNRSSRATGLGQVMPREAGFANRPTQAELMDPATNLEWSARILSEGIKRYGSEDKGLAAYLGSIDSKGNITGAVDANGTGGNTYIQNVRQRQGKYQGEGAPAAAAVQEIADRQHQAAEERRTAYESVAAPVQEAGTRVQNLANALEQVETELGKIGSQFGGARESGRSEAQLTELHDALVQQMGEALVDYTQTEEGTQMRVDSLLTDSPSAVMQATAADYRTSQGMDRDPALPRRVTVDPRARQIAAWFNDTQVAPETLEGGVVTASDLESPDPARRSYAHFAQETLDQYKALQGAGVIFTPYHDEAPAGDGTDFHNYANSAAARADLRGEVEHPEIPGWKRGTPHLYVYADHLDHPLMGQLPGTEGPEGNLNYIFRGVHDAFGHGQHKNQFGPQGEEAAHWDHFLMFSPEAQPAMFAETKGQNSWVNFYGDHQSLPITERPYADQKPVMPPAEFMSRSDLRFGKERGRRPVSTGQRGSTALSIADDIGTGPRVQRGFLTGADRVTSDVYGRPIAGTLADTAPSADQNQALPYGAPQENTVLRAVYDAFEAAGNDPEAVDLTSVPLAPGDLKAGASFVGAPTTVPELIKQIQSGEDGRKWYYEIAGILKDATTRPNGTLDQGLLDELTFAFGMAGLGTEPRVNMRLALTAPLARAKLQAEGKWDLVANPDNDAEAGRRLLYDTIKALGASPPATGGRLITQNLVNYYRTGTATIAGGTKLANYQGNVADARENLANIISTPDRWEFRRHGYVKGESMASETGASQYVMALNKEIAARYFPGWTPIEVQAAGWTGYRRAKTSEKEAAAGAPDNVLAANKSVFDAYKRALAEGSLTAIETAAPADLVHDTLGTKKNAYKTIDAGAVSNIETRDASREAISAQARQMRFASPFQGADIPGILGLPDVQATPEKLAGLHRKWVVNDLGYRRDRDGRGHLAILDALRIPHTAVVERTGRWDGDTSYNVVLTMDLADQATHDRVAALMGMVNLQNSVGTYRPLLEPGEANILTIPHPGDGTWTEPEIQRHLPFSKEVLGNFEVSRDGRTIYWPEYSGDLDAQHDRLVKAGVQEEWIYGDRGEFGLVEHGDYADHVEQLASSLGPAEQATVRREVDRLVGLAAQRLAEATGGKLPDDWKARVDAYTRGGSSARDIRDADILDTNSTRGFFRPDTHVDHDRTADWVEEVAEGVDTTPANPRGYRLPDGTVLVRPATNRQTDTDIVRPETLQGITTSGYIGELAGTLSRLQQGFAQAASGHPMLQSADPNAQHMGAEAQPFLFPSMFVFGINAIRQGIYNPSQSDGQIRMEPRATGKPRTPGGRQVIGLNPWMVATMARHMEGVGLVMDAPATAAAQMAETMLHEVIHGSGLVHDRGGLSDAKFNALLGAARRVLRPQVDQVVAELTPVFQRLFEDEEFTRDTDALRSDFTDFANAQATAPLFQRVLQPGQRFTDAATFLLPGHARADRRLNPGERSGVGGDAVSGSGTGVPELPAEGFWGRGRPAPVGDREGGPAGSREGGESLADRGRRLLDAIPADTTDEDALATRENLELALNTPGNEDNLRSAILDASEYAGGVAIVPPQVALRQPGRVAVPTDASFTEAAKNTPGVTVSPEGVELDLSRWQKPGRGGTLASPSGVFYSPVAPGTATQYAGEAGVYGGSENLGGRTVLRAPLVVEADQVGQLGLFTRVKLNGADTATQDLAQMERLQSRLRQGGATPETVDAIHSYLESQVPGADRATAEAIAQQGAEDGGNRAVSAMTEYLAAHEARQQGYDSIVTTVPSYERVNGKMQRVNKVGEVFDLREATYPTREGGFTLHPEFQGDTADSVLDSFTDEGREKYAKPYLEGLFTPTTLRAIDSGRATPAEQARYDQALQNLQARVKAGNVDFDYLKDTAAFRSATASGAKAQAVTSGGKVAGEWAQRLRYASILSGPAGAIGDLVSNGLNIPRIYVRTGLAATFEQMKGVPQDQRSATFNELAGLWKGQTSSVGAAFRDAVDVMLHGREPVASEQARTLVGREVLGSEKLATGLGLAVEGGSRLRIASDALFQHVGEQGAVHMLAYRQAAREGLTGARAQSRITGLITDITTELQKTGTDTVKQGGTALPDTKTGKVEVKDLAAEARAIAKRSIFQQELGRNATKAGGVRGDTAVGWVVPFYKTLANIAAEGATGTPVFGALGVGVDLARENSAYGTKANKGRGDRFARTDNAAVLPASQRLADQTMGVLAAGAGFAFTVSGLMTGPGPGDERERKAWLDSGKRPYSWVVKHSDGHESYVPLTRILGPMALPLVVGSAAAEWSKGNPNREPDENLWKQVALATRDEWFKTSGLEAFDQLLNASGGEGRFSTRNMTRAGASLAGGFIPGAGLLRTIEAATDPAVRDPKTLVEMIKSGVPGLAGDVAPKRNEQGETLRRAPGASGARAALPFQSSEGQPGVRKYAGSTSEHQDVLIDRAIARAKDSWKAGKQPTESDMAILNRYYPNWEWEQARVTERQRKAAK